MTTRLQGSSYPRQRAFFHDNEIAAAEARVREQEAHVLRLIVQGAPTQKAEDVLQKLAAAAAEVRERKRLAQR